MKNFGEIQRGQQVDRFRMGAALTLRMDWLAQKDMRRMGRTGLVNRADRGAIMARIGLRKRHMSRCIGGMTYINTGSADKHAHLQRKNSNPSHITHNPNAR